MMLQYLYTGTMISNQTGVDIGMSSTSSDQPKELCSSGDEHIPKVRKTYTITKQRERWTDEEHTKFLDALKLYGRAWRKIEERVGTKTAVQIRSHAQKFFSKVVRESASNSTGSTKPIEIPPPRPKRKPLHPYPRKLATSSSKKLSALKKPERSHSPTKSISEAQTGSPTSVLSPIGSDAMGSNTPKPCGSLDSYVSNSRVTGLFRNVQESIFYPYPSAAEEENGSHSSGTNSSAVITDKKSDVELEDTSVEAPITSLKLFGKTVVITEVSSTSAPLTTHDLESFRLDDGDGSKVGIKKDEQTSTPEPTENVTTSMTQQDSYSVSCQVPWNPWSCVAPPFLYPMKQEIKNESSTTIAAPLPWWPFFGGLPFPLNSCFNEHLPESGKSTTSLDSKVRPLDHNEPKTDDSNFKSSSEKPVRGFMPYKRCSSEREDYQLVKKRIIPEFACACSYDDPIAL